MIKKILTKIIKWALKDELAEMKEAIRTSNNHTSRAVEKVSYTERELRQRIDQFERLLGDTSVAVDVHESKHGRSWAVVAVPGKGMDYVRFFNLDYRSGREIMDFLSQFNPDRVSIDANPHSHLKEKLYRSRRG